MRVNSEPLPSTGGIDFPRGQDVTEGAGPNGGEAGASTEQSTGSSTHQRKNTFHTLKKEVHNKRHGGMRYFGLRNLLSVVGRG